MDSIVNVSGLGKNYGSFEALKGLDLEIQAGECVGLLGSNGAGKSTTIRMITGQLKPSFGKISVFNINPSLEPKKIHPFIGYIPDNQALYDELSVFDNIDIFRQLFARPKEDTQSIIERIGLLHKKNEKVKDLSKGLKQRVLIARALVHHPKFILLDEPTTGLDPNSAESIYKILEELKKTGSTILLTTHLMNDVERLCDRIVFLNEGQKVEEGSPRELKKKYGEPKVYVQLNQQGRVETHCIENNESFLQNLKSLKEKGNIESIRSHEPKLEEIFIHLVKERP